MRITNAIKDTDITLLSEKVQSSLLSFDGLMSEHELRQLAADLENAIANREHRKMFNLAGLILRIDPTYLPAILFDSSLLSELIKLVQTTDNSFELINYILGVQQIYGLIKEEMGIDPTIIEEMYYNLDFLFRNRKPQEGMLQCIRLQALDISARFDISELEQYWPEVKADCSRYKGVHPGDLLATLVYTRLVFPQHWNEVSHLAKQFSDIEGYLSSVRAYFTFQDIVSVDIVAMAANFLKLLHAPRIAITAKGIEVINETIANQLTPSSLLVF